MSEQPLVVIGAGLAAAHVVQTLRDRGDQRPIVLVGDEGEPPYERPGLSKGVLQGNDELSSVYVHDQDWYSGHSIDARFGDRAVAVDVAARTVQLASGNTVNYSDLVLTTGAQPRTLPIPGAELAGVHTVRRIPDSVALKEKFAPEVKVVIIGAGWIGLEVAAAARQAGATVTVLEAADVPLRTALGSQLGRYFAELHRRNGVDLRTGVSVSAIEGNGQVSGVRVDGELLDADVVVIGVGASPDTGLAAEAGLSVDNGILVDDQLRAAGHVYAAGDVANAEHTSLGRLRVEHWDNAIKQGELVARVLAGEDAHYDWQPYFYTDQFDLGMEYVGRCAPDDEVVIRGDQSAGEFIAFWLRDGRISAAMNVNIWDVNDDLRALIGRTIPEERLADARLELGEL